MRRITRFFRRLLLFLGIVLLLLLALYWKVVSYGVRMARGQLSLVWNARPIDEVMADPASPDTLKEQLRLLEAIRSFAVDSLDLKDTKNYRTLYDQQGKPVMWVVTAAEPFALKAKEWSFPVVGDVPYKGFFNQTEAEHERDEMEREGYDVRLQNPGAWSTLGWFTDPVLSEMLHRSEGDLASLIIHEMVHATLFIKDSVEFNENLASFIGDLGAEKFLRSKYGVENPIYTDYVHDLSDYNKFAAHMLQGADVLDSLYAAESDEHDLSIKTFKKEKVIERIVANLDTLTLYAKGSYANLFRERMPNNAYFLAFRRYHSQQQLFTEQWETRFKRDFKSFLNFYRKNHGTE